MLTCSYLQNIPWCVFGLGEQQSEACPLRYVVLGSEKTLFENVHHLHIYAINDYESTYGVVIGEESRLLQKCFNMFKKNHIADVFRNIKDNIDSIEVRYITLLNISAHDLYPSTLKVLI